MNQLENKKTRVDLHNHTILCNHAEGSVEEYVKKAIELGVDEYGFACHAPMNYDPKYRMKLEERSIYEKWVNEAKEKYKDQIKVLLGYEVDYLKGYMLDEILNAKVDYLIGSVHFLQNQNDMWGFDNPEFIGVYLDLIKVFKFLPQKDVRILAQNALKEIKKANMVLEINPAGLRKPIGECYPSKPLLEEAFSLGIDITFGSDAHKVEHVGFGYEEAVNLVKSVGYSECITFENRDKKRVKF